MKKIFPKISSIYSSNKLPWAIICFGIFLRLIQYLYNRSLWFDEASLALNIVNRSLPQLLLKPLDLTAPLGFLTVEKIMIFVFGNNEYALRLFPLLAGVISLFLFYKVTKVFLGNKAILIALGLFAISDPLIYYSSEVKQYSSDVAIALLIYVITFHYTQLQKLTFWRATFFGFIGAIAIWFSHPAVFVLAGVVTVLIFLYVREKEWQKITNLSIAFLVWIASFAICYFISLRNLVSNNFLLTVWASRFAPSISKLWQAKWYIDTFFNIFKHPVGIPLCGIAALSFIVGGVSMFREKRRDFFFLILPILFTLLASWLKKYPFSGRLLLFIVPNVLIFIAEGTEQIIAKTRHTFSIIGITFISLLFFYPLLKAGYHIIRPRLKEEIKPVINYLMKFKQNKDIIYLYYGSRNAFKYYSLKNGFNENEYIVGIESRARGNLGNYINDLNKLRGNKRVWIVFSHIYNWKRFDEERFFLYYLDSIGKRLNFFKSAGASVYLYDLSQ